MKPTINDRINVAMGTLDERLSFSHLSVFLSHNNIIYDSCTGSHLSQW